jgi:hypothetical protein
MTRRPAHITFSFGCLLLALSADFLIGQETEKPSPKDGTVTAVKGQPVTIELTSDARTRASVVEFLIRDFPLSGDLGALVSRGEDRTKAAITYTPLQDTAATADSFTYAVRYPGGLWSTKGKVTIKLVASEPAIGATAEADFGKVMIGQSETRDIFLSNSGNATYRNQIRLAPPFSIEDPENGLLDLAIGGQKVVKVRFTPVAEGPANLNLVFFRNDGGSTVLRGSGYAPFSLAVSEVTLRWEEKSRTRLGTIGVTGIAPKLLAASVQSSDPRLQAGAPGGTLILKPGETADLPVYLPADDVRPFEGAIEIAVGEYKLPVMVKAAVAPAYLVVENAGNDAGDRVIDFGSIKPGGVAQGSFQLRNAGGTACKVNFNTSAPFSILAAGGRATLDPGESEAFAIRVAAPDHSPGPYEGALKIEADSGQIIPVTLRAVFLTGENVASAMSANPGTFAPSFAVGPNAAGTTPAAAAAPPGPAPRRPTPEEEQRAIEEMEKLRSPLGFITLPTVERRIDPNVPPVARDSMKLIEDGTGHLTVGWTPPVGSTGDFEIEMRMMRQKDQNSPLESVWVPHHDVQFLPDGSGQMAADIRGLAPNRTYEFRLFTLGQGGEVSAPLPFVAKTQMPLDWTWIYISFGLLLLGSVGYFGWRRWGAGLQQTTVFQRLRDQMGDLFG